MRSSSMWRNGVACRTLVPVTLLGLGVLVACSDPNPSETQDAGAVDAGRDAGDANVDSGEPDAGAVDDRRCGVPEPSSVVVEPSCVPSMAGETVTYVIDSVGFTRPASETSQTIPGFDVDGEVSDATDEATCFKEDYVSDTPDMTPGIDNELGVAIARLGIDDNFNEGFLDAIHRGDLLLLLEVSDVDDFDDDPCVHVDFLVGVLPAGIAAPAVDVDGRLTLDQVLDVSAASFTSPGGPARYRMLDARIVGGRLEGRASEINLPTAVPTEFIALSDVPQFMVQVDLAVTSEGFDQGILGGAQSIEATVAGAQEAGAEPDIQDAVRSLMVGAADLYRINDECKCASVGYALTGRRVTRGELVP